MLSLVDGGRSAIYQWRERRETGGNGEKRGHFITDGMSARKFEYGRRLKAVEPKCARIQERPMERKAEVEWRVLTARPPAGERERERDTHTLRERERECVCVCACDGSA